MCGIAGILNLQPRNPIPLSSLQQMVKILRHRGSDESGIYIDDSVGLGQTRLSIIDLAGGSQPIANEDQSLWIVYNGEVFNYVELREDLIRRGHRFTTTTDTEVILHLYEDKGPACLQDLNGQFAIAIWDSRRKRLFLARDRIGIRPLHYTNHGGQLVFASEIKAIFTNREIARRIDPVAMDQIFTFWTTLKGRTAFEGIRELPPGFFLIAYDGQVRIEQFWDLPFVPKDQQIRDRPGEIAETVNGLLQDAIRIRLRADVPVGCYLSGGLDSSGITSRIVRHFNSRVQSFGIRFEEQAFDEGVYQQQMVNHLGVNHQEMLATNRMIGESFPEVIRHCEKPLLRTAPVPLYLLSRLVNQNGFKVVLTGEGADEMFGGYNVFREALIRRFWSSQPTSSARPALLGQLYPYIFSNPRSRATQHAFFGKGIDRPDDPLFSHRIRWDNTSRIKTFFSEDLRKQIGSYSGYEEVTAGLPSSFPQWDTLQKAQYLEATIFLSNYLLSSQGDRVAMAHSLEIRLPYLDYRIMEYMAKVPSKWKILGLKEKHLLKQVLRDDVPESIRNRPKHPYRAPIAQTLLQTHPDFIEGVLSENHLRHSGLFDPAKVRMLVNKLSASTNPGEFDSMALTGILSTVLLKQQMTSASPRVPDISVQRLIDYRTIS